MSWSRIIRFAKQRQVPVIITDETGEDPMILVSLDALEQALDGSVGPDIPTPPPAPRSTTPSFVPEPEPAVKTATEVSNTAPFVEPIMYQEPVSSLVIDDFETPTPAASVPVSSARAADIEIMTLPEVPETASTPELMDSVLPEKTKDISLEERFFLDL